MQATVRGYIVANRPGMSGTVPELAYLPRPAMESQNFYYCPGNANLLILYVVAMKP